MTLKQLRKEFDKKFSLSPMNRDGTFNYKRRDLWQWILKNLEPKVDLSEICFRCGHKKGRVSGGCSAWGSSWKRHWYRTSKNINKEGK